MIKFFTLFTLCAIFFSCAETDIAPTLEQQLQGAWQKKAGVFQINYIFHDGAADAYVVFSGQQIQQNNYVYTIEGNDLTLLDLVEGSRAKYLVEFDTDSTAILHQYGGINVFLKRLK